MKFAHMADVHLGSWNNHPDMRDYPLAAFKEAVDICASSGVDFILITGDLFDSSIPPIDAIRYAATNLRRCKELGIRVYTIPGSHDFSPTGKTMLTVFEDAGLVTNVAEIVGSDGSVKMKTARDKSGAIISGMIGMKGGLEKNHYENIQSSKEQGLKIFMFHSALAEYMPPHLKGIDAISVDMLPKNFNYYAGGHVHQKFEKDEPFGKIVFPGPLFPTSFDEMEKSRPGFFIVHCNGKYVNAQWIEMSIVSSVMIEIDANGKSAKSVEECAISKIEKMDVENSIILMKIKGVLESGRPSDIDFRLIAEKARQNDAKTVKKNISALSAKEFETVEIIKDLTVEELEKTMIDEQPVVKISRFSERGIKKMTSDIMNIFMDEKADGETNGIYEERIKSGAKKAFDL